MHAVLVKQPKHFSHFTLSILTTVFLGLSAPQRLPPFNHFFNLLGKNKGVVVYININNNYNIANKKESSNVKIKDTLFDKKI
jgi:hypothetical protein